MEGRTDVWKFTPVFYRTSALWGRCPIRDSERNPEKLMAKPETVITAPCNVMADAQRR